MANEVWKPGKNTVVVTAKVATVLAVGYAAGAVAPWLAGAIAGSLVPGVGTVIGFIVEGVAAYYSSEYVD